MGSSRYTPEEVYAIQNLSDTGLRTGTIAARVNRSTKALGTLFSRLGWSDDKIGNPRRPYTPTELKLARRWMKSGHKIETVARALKRAPSGLRRVLKRV